MRPHNAINPYAAGGPPTLERAHIREADMKAQWSIEPIRPYNWRVEAACAQVDPKLFHLEKGESTREAKLICNGDSTRGVPACPVRERCLEEALEREERFGVWGGVSERDRRKMVKARKERAA